MAALVHAEPGDFVAALGECFAVFGDGGMLDFGGDDVLPVGIEAERGGDGGVVGFGAAACEKNLARLASEQPGDLLAGFVNRGGGFFPEGIRAGWVAVLLGQKRQHFLDHGGINLRGGVVVQIDERGVL